jgi:hypothetical protein
MRIVPLVLLVSGLAAVCGDSGDGLVQTREACDGS